MAEDKRTIGVTEAADGVLAVMVEQGHFSDAIDAAKFAMALAISSQADAGDLTVEGTTTKWNVGSFDPDSQLRSLLDALYPDVDQPYRLLEFLINDGLHRVSKHIESIGELDVIALLDEAESRSSAAAP
ncbi:MAG: hypothetical protein F4189_14020 [Acidimicrobiaceae bacterium]|nr:hypothetical protein [Acidimicrobiaceae bacterium]